MQHYSSSVRLEGYLSGKIFGKIKFPNVRLKRHNFQGSFEMSQFFGEHHLCEDAGKQCTRSTVNLNISLHSGKIFLNIIKD